MPQPPHNKLNDPNPVNDRFGGFESSEDPYVFDVRPVMNQNNYVQGNPPKTSWNSQNKGLNDLYYTQPPGKIL